MLILFTVSASKVPMASSFRIRAWPEHHIEVPQVRRHHVTNVDAQVLEFQFGDLRPAALPAEFFLRELADLDELNVNELVVFSQEWGSVAHLGEDPLAFLPTAKYSITKPYVSYTEAAAAITTKYSQRVGTRLIAVPILQLHVQILKALTRQWLHQSSGGSGSGVATWEGTPFEPATDTQAWKLFFEHLDHGLQHFSAHVSSPDIDWEPPQANLYMACCLQIFNHIAERATYRTCANETCRRAFSQQRGRRTTGSPRTRGVRYCSPTCAKAQAQRDYYSRERAKEVDDV